VSDSQNGPAGAVGSIAVIGLGYVGLPLAVALARHGPVTGFDIDGGRVGELMQGHDRTGEVMAAALLESRLAVTVDESALANHDAFIVTVPTPIDDDRRPDLTAVRSAMTIVGRALAASSAPAGAPPVVVLESTVYPGVTEDICGTILAETSGRRRGTGFVLGYSPERMNPGDREHTVERIQKVVAGEDDATCQRLMRLYGRINGGRVFAARSIRTAEAAKVIENAQRDVNIAFINEVAMIFAKAGIPVQDVLAAAATKWNFLPFQPGLVGGHCIGIDPYYLAQFAADMGHDAEVILSGRRINDAMGDFLAGQIAAALAGESATPDGRVLVLGLTFKEDVPDLRNSRVVDLVAGLTARGLDVSVHDPLADEVEAKRIYGLDIIGGIRPPGDWDCVVGAVAHQAYRRYTADDLTRLVRPDGLVADIKGMWRDVSLPYGYRRWSL
jgi:UDP-N-acetyl-D-galactosamine dehydrogenase